MVSRLLGKSRNLDRAQIDQKMRSISGEQTLPAVYNTPIIYSGFQIRAPVGKPFSPFNSHPKHFLWVLKEPSQWDSPSEHPKHIFNIDEKKNMLRVQKRTISFRRFFWAPKKTHAWYWREKSYQIYTYKIIRTMDYSGTLEAYQKSEIRLGV